MLYSLVYSIDNQFFESFFKVNYLADKNLTTIYVS